MRNTIALACMVLFVGGLHGCALLNRPPVATSEEIRAGERDSGAVEDRSELDSVDSRKPWHLDLGFRASFIRLESTKETLSLRVEPLLKIDPTGLFRDPTTPIDRRRELGLNTFHLGLGRRETDSFVWTAQVGAGVGSDKSHQRILTTNLSVRFRYAYYFVRGMAQIYPWGTPQLVRGATWGQRLTRSRPFVSTGFELAYLNAEGAGDYSVAPFKFYKDKGVVRDWLLGGSLGGGWDVPLGDRWSAQLSGEYTFHLHRPEEYNGWSVTTNLRYAF